MIIHKELEQRSEEWFSIRSGIPTASAANKILTPGGKLSSTSKKYLCELLAERAGFADEPFEPTDHMLRGIEIEPEARDFFAFDTGLDIREVGFITNDDSTAGASPDGLIYEDGIPFSGLEIKVPRPSTHISYLIDGTLPSFYAPQIHFSMAISGLNQWRFLSYCPGLDPLIVTVDADEYTDKITAAIAEFTDRLETEAKRLGLAK